MNTAAFWSRAMVIVGLLAMLIGAIDPLEGSVLILVGVVLVGLGAHIGMSRQRTLLFGRSPWSRSVLRRCWC